MTRDPSPEVLGDGALGRLRSLLAEPDLAGTRYRLEGPIGRGGMGAVWRVRDRSLGRSVALKLLDAPDPGGTLARRLAREARVLARLEHPGIVPVHEVGRLGDGRAFYTMKLVEGERLDRHARRPLGLNDRLRLFQRVCEPVAFAHARGVVHRDLKPDNVMVGRFGEVLVLDWGVAKLVPGAAAEPEGGDAGDPDDADPDEGAAGARTDGEVDPFRAGAAAASPRGAPSVPTTAHGTVVGTPGYMPPEQARGGAAPDPRADVHALGALLAFLVARAERGPGPPPPVASIVRRATAPDPAARYPDAASLAADVGRFLDGLAVEAHPEGALARGLRLARRHRTAVALVAAYLAMRIALLIATGR